MNFCVYSALLRTLARPFLLSVLTASCEKTKLKVSEAKYEVNNHKNNESPFTRPELFRDGE